MPTSPQPLRFVPPTHRRSRRSSSGAWPRWGHIGHIPPERQGQQRSRAVGQHPSSTAPFGQHGRSSDRPALSRTEEARGSNPLTSTPNLAGQSVASLKRAALTACWAELGPRTAPGRVLDVGWGAAGEAGRPSEQPFA
jgi:hypothetical protein